MRELQNQLKNLLSGGVQQPRRVVRPAGQPTPEPPIPLLGLVLRLIALVIIDTLIWMLHAALIDDTLENSVEINRLFIEISYFGLFIPEALAEFGSRELLAAVLAALFCASALAVWTIILNDFRKFQGSIGDKFAGFFLCGVYCLVIWAEYVLLEARVSLAGSLVPIPQDIRPGLAMLLGMTFVAATSFAALVTTSLAKAIKDRRSGS